MSVWLGAIYATGTEETRRGLAAIASGLAPLLLGGVAIGFLLVCIRRAIDAARSSGVVERWRIERRNYRARAEQAAREYAPSPAKNDRGQSAA
jgi:hypothetical protein